MELLIKPKADITFHRSGLIELSSRLVRGLGLTEADYINFGPACTRIVKCGYGLKVRKPRRTKKEGGFMRANSKYICSLVTSEEVPVAKFRMGSICDNVANIITKKNYADTKRN